MTDKEKYLDKPVIQDLKAEQQVLGWAMLDDECLKHAFDKLQTKHFLQGKHKLIYAALLKCWGEHKTINLVSLQDILRKGDILGHKGDMLEAAGGIAYLVELQEDVDCKESFKSFVRRVFLKATLREFTECGNRIMELCYKQDEQIEA